MHVFVGGPSKDDVFGDSINFASGPLSLEHEVVDLGFPRPKTRTRAGARCAPLLTMTTIAGAAFGLEVVRLVDPKRVVVAEDIMRTRQHTTCAARAQATRDDLIPEMGPMCLVGPFGLHRTGGSCADRGFGGGRVDDAHDRNVAEQRDSL